LAAAAADLLQEKNNVSSLKITLNSAELKMVDKGSVY
jgi:hypothetical protein